MLRTPRTPRRTLAVVSTGVLAIAGLTASCDDDDATDDEVELDVNEDEIQEDVNDVGEDIEDGVDDAGDEIQDGVDDAGDEIEDGLDDPDMNGDG